MDKVETLKQWVDDSQRIVFFGGAGVSTESGIPDFRSASGLYNQKHVYPPEMIISHRFYREKTEVFFDFYRDKMMYLDAEPNITHKKLVQWERAGKDVAVVTQNIDGLHQKAGSKTVYELHGSIMRNYCTRCGKFHSAQFVKASKGIPYCECGGVIKPDVVLYDEPLDAQTVDNTLAAIRSADMLIIAGTSLTVYPAAGFIGYFPGKYMVLINRDETPFDFKVDMVINDSLGNVFSRL